MSDEILSWPEFHAKQPEISKLRYDAMVRKYNKAKGEAERAGKPRKGKDAFALFPKSKRVKR